MKGETVDYNKKPLIYPINSEEHRVLFNFDEVYKECRHLESITFNIFNSRQLNYIYNRINDTNNLDYSDRNKHRLFISTLPLKESYINRLLRNYNIVSTKWIKLFDLLFVGGVPIDMTHEHGGQHNAYTIPHLSHTDPTPVKWLAHFLGIPYGATLSFNGYSREMYLKFDSSGLDCSPLSFLNQVIGLVCTTGKRGTDLFRLLGPVRVWTPNRVIYDSEEDFHDTGEMLWSEGRRVFHRILQPDGVVRTSFFDFPEVWA